MRANAKKATEFPSRAATFTAEIDGASDSERGKVVVEKRPRRMLPSTLEGSAALSYADVGFFFVFVFFLAMMLRIGVQLHVVSQTRLDNPTLPFQVTISLSLIGSLYAIIRLRHGHGVWARLGWIWPTRIHLVAALVGGIGLGIGVDFIAHATTPTTHVIHMWNLILLDGLLGQIIEESLFRGCLLPVVARTTGPTIGIAVHGRTLRHIPSNHHVRAMALPLDDGDCVWMDPSQVGVYRGIDSDARDIQCDSVLEPGVVDDRRSLHLSRGVHETRVSPPRVIFARLEPVIDSL